MTLEVLRFGEARSIAKGRGSKPGGKEGLFKVVDRDERKTFTAIGIECYWDAVEILRVHESFGTSGPTQRDYVSIGSFNALLSSYIPLALQPFMSETNRRDRPVIRLHELDTPEIFQAVASKRVDFAIGSMPSSRDEVLAQELVSVERLDLAVERGLLVAPDHPLAKKKKIVATDLAREVVLRFPARMTTPGLDTWLTPDPEKGGDTLEVPTFGVMLGFIKLNLGVALVANVPNEIQDAIDLKKVVYRPLRSLEHATIAAYLPKKRGIDGLSPGAKRVYTGIADFFRGLAVQQTSRSRKKR
jgi:DNA-binding transcriptional LysR family regulator